MKKLKKTEEVKSKLQKKKVLKRDVEISDEALEKRRLLEAFLLDKKEELLKADKERRERIEKEIIQLRGGISITREQITQFVQSSKRIYSAVFPNTDRFFQNMFRLHPKLQGYDPNKYEKPFLAGILLKKLTYDRFTTEFSQDVLSALIVFAMPGGVRIHKCHEYLTDDGVKELKRFRDDANLLMDKYDDGQWYEFYKKFTELYKQTFQPRMF